VLEQFSPGSQVELQLLSQEAIPSPKSQVQFMLVSHDSYGELQVLMTQLSPSSQLPLQSTSQSLPFLSSKSQTKLQLRSQASLVHIGSLSKDTGLPTSTMCSNIVTVVQLRVALYMQVVKCSRVRMSRSIEPESSNSRKMFDVAPTLMGKGTLGKSTDAAAAGKGVDTPAPNVNNATSNKE
jgi:hypothetical protein